jgi:hypothetical protein
MTDPIDQWARQIAQMRSVQKELQTEVEQAVAEALENGDTERLITVIAAQQVALEDLFGICTRLAAELAAEGLGTD